MRQTQFIVLEFLLTSERWFLIILVACHLCRNKEVDIDVDQFIKDMESIMKQHGSKGANSDIEEGSSSDLDFGKVFVLIFAV